MLRHIWKFSEKPDPARRVKCESRAYNVFRCNRAWEQTKRCKLTECGDCGCRPLCGASVARHPALTRTHTILGIRCIQQNLMIRHPCTFVWYALCTLNPKCRCCRFSAPQATFWNALCCLTVVWCLRIGTWSVNIEVSNVYQTAANRVVCKQLSKWESPETGWAPAATDLFGSTSKAALRSLNVCFSIMAIFHHAAPVAFDLMGMLMTCFVLCCRLWLSILNLVQKLSWE